MKRTTLAGIICSLFACAPSVDAPGSRPETVLSPTIDVRPAALVNGRMVEWSELRPMLNEAAGAAVLQELVLDRMLAAALETRGLVVLPDDIDREQHLFYTTLDPDPNVSARIARELRERRGLGPKRFRQLLERNAGLRALVAGEVTVTEAAIERTHEIVHGPKRQARIMVLPDLGAAEAALGRLEAGAFFGDLAVELSTDSSAARGGLLEPISRGDPAYPQAIREALWSLGTGEVSPPVLVENGYALVMQVREIPGDEMTLEEARPELERLVRLDQQRLLMDRLARQLLQQATVTVIDESLRASWERR